MAHVQYTNRCPSFGRFEWLSGPFWAEKKAVLGHKMRSFRRAPADLVPLPRGATGEFLAENLDLARAPPRV